MSRSQFRLLACRLPALGCGWPADDFCDGVNDPRISRESTEYFSDSIPDRTGCQPSLLLAGTAAGRHASRHVRRSRRHVLLLATGTLPILRRVILRFLMSPILWSWHAETGWNMSIGAKLRLFSKAFIFALAFFGPAKPLFRDSEESELRPISTDPTCNPVTLYDLVGQWQLYLDSVSRTVSVDFRDDGTFVQRIIRQSGWHPRVSGGNVESRRDFGASGRLRYGWRWHQPVA